MKLRIFNNELDVTEYSDIEYECLLKEWMQIRVEYPNARLYKDVICIQNDVTPKTKHDALKLLEADGDYQVLCHAGTPLEWAIATFVISVGMAVYTYMNMPKIDTAADTSGSGNNSLGQRQNKHRVNQRVPDIYGTVKSIPDLIAPVYRYYKDNIQVEECLLCIGRGYFEIDSEQIKEGETPINTINGASLSIYEPNQLLMTSSPQIKIGEEFEDIPLVTKQVSSIDGKQTLIPPNNAMVRYFFVSFNGNTITVNTDSPQYFEMQRRWETTHDTWEYITEPIYANFQDHFSNNEKIIIENAVFGHVSDTNISGTTDISDDGFLTIVTSIIVN